MTDPTAAPTTRPIYIAIKGTVLALARSSGEILWTHELAGFDFVNLVLDGDDLLATTKGEIFCLDPSTGQLRWHNPLRGYGYGIVSIAQAPTTQSALAEKSRRDEAQRARASS